MFGLSEFFVEQLMMGLAEPSDLERVIVIVVMTLGIWVPADFAGFLLQFTAPEINSGVTSCIRFPTLEGSQRVGFTPLP